MPVKIIRSLTLGVVLTASVLGSAVLSTGSAAAAGDPCLSAGYVKVASGDVGASGWYPNPSYNVDYQNHSRWGSSSGVDHNLQWEMTYQSSTRTAQFCARNLKAIGRTALEITTDLYDARGARTSTAFGPARSVPAGAGWVSLAKSHLPSGWGYQVHLGDYWSNGYTQGWSNPGLYSFPKCTAAAAAATTPAGSAGPTPAGC